MTDKIYKSDVWRDNIFAGKVVLCTGGAGTICSVQVGAMIQLGANAAIIGRRGDVTSSKAAELQSLRSGSRVLGISADVRSFDSLQSAVETTIRELGRLDYVICGAAGNFLATVENLSPNAFKAVMDIDVLGSYNTVKAALPYLKESRGKILFVSATLHYTGTPFQAHVSAAKAAVDALSQVLAVELGPYGITSNVVAPGPIAGTEGMARLSREDTGQVLRKATPLQRFGKTHEIADATIYLFSSAGDYVTGDIIVVDGGTWHRQGAGSMGMEYPEAITSGAIVTGVAGMKKETSKL
ncbi:NAD(P)-binding protein [Ascodesmis nigricans]|uniref:2,4-dienoyl-CoA reductase [(3E)-enoyl-CoA-producing] n=1 Tax=Ascodesmis nigricans TaxID=341454 RepID=A0A4S2MIZ7_9PEZI|nr:NAD(P)-binding protein [Ascodesmis nigricans]